MKPALFYDTETTGLPLFEQPSEDPRQPHIVQLGALLIDLDTRRELASLDLIVRPEGWEIPADVAAIHGITQEMALDLGVPERTAVEALLAMWGLGRELRERVAHNETFDARIMRIAIKRHIDVLTPGSAVVVSDVWKGAKARCTARMSTHILQLPPTDRMKGAGRFHYKTPKLSEAYKHFTGQELDGAHNAMVDVRGCATVFFAMSSVDENAPVPA